MRTKRSMPALLLLTLSVSALVAAAQEGGMHEAGGLRWQAPADWRLEADRPMRVATYRLPAAAEDQDPGECGVFFFGKGQGGSVEDNVRRWFGQFRTAAGEPIDPEGASTRQEINGIFVTTVEISGTFLSRPFPAAPEPTEKLEYRLLAAIAEGADGLVFFKLTAPRRTAAAAATDFHAMLSSLERNHDATDNP